MNPDYLPYAIVELYCILFATIMLFQLSSSLGTEHEVKQLRNMIYTYFGFLLSDIVFGLSEGGFLQLSRMAYLTDSAITVFAITLGCYFWFRFVEDRLHPAYSLNRAYRYLVNVPVAIVLVLDVVSIFTGFLFRIDQAGEYQATDFFLIQSVINFSYALIPTINSIYLAMRTRSKLRQSEYAIYAIYILAPVTAALMEDAFPTVPVLALNIFAVILLLFLNLQNMQIFNDALTDLNNRRRLDQYLEQRLENTSAENPVILFMMDINSFKSINDKYGHVEGDRALKLFAQALKIAAHRHGAFIARYGGDEFCLVTTEYQRTAEKIETDINEAIQQVREAEAVPPPYAITVSMGYATRNAPEYNAGAFIAEADKMLYENKKKWHRENG